MRLVLVWLAACGLLAFAFLIYPRGPMEGRARPTPEPDGGARTRSGLEVADDPAPPPKETLGQPERSASSRTSRSHSVSLELAWEDGSRGVDLLVLLAAEDRVLAQGTTDLGGRVAFPSVEPAGVSLRVFQGEVQLLETELPGDRSDARILVPSHGAVRGIVLVDGHRPTEPVSLELYARLGRDRSLHTPSFVRRAMGWKMLPPRTMSTRTDGEGRFTFAALELTHGALLSCAEAYRLASGEDFLRLAGLRSDLIVVLEGSPSVRGLVLSPAGEPVEGCAVRINPSCADAAYPVETETRADGSFRQWIACKEPRTARIEFSAEGVGVRTLQAELDPRSGVDLGEIRLERARGWSFRALDPEGRPIPGAVATSEHGRTESAGSDGICTFASPVGESELVTLRALAFRPHELPPGEARGEGDPLDVVLEPMTMLEVRFHQPDGSPAPGVHVFLEASSLFEKGESSGHAFQSMLGASRFEFGGGLVSGDPEGFSSARFRCGHSDRFVVTGLRPDVAIQLAAEDGIGNEVGWTATIRLREGERRQMDAVLLSELRTLEGRVLGEGGRPVAGAVVSVPLEGWDLVKTDSRGRFHVGPYAERGVQLVVRAKGYGTKVIPNFPAEGGPDVELERGGAHRLHVIDAEGRPVSASHVQAWVDGAPVGLALHRDDGSYLFENFPSGEVEIRVTFGGIFGPVGGWTYTVLAEEGSETTLRVPAMGTLVLTWRNPIAPGALAGARVWSPPRHGHTVFVMRSPEELATDPTATLSLPPGSYRVEWVLAVDGETFEPVGTGNVEVLEGETSATSF